MSSNGSETASALADSGVLDLTRLQEAFEDDVEGIATLLEMALETGKKHRSALAAGLITGDAAVVARAAHGIKGSAGNIGANAVYLLASDLDARARLGDLAGAAERAAAIDAEYERVAIEVRAYRAKLTE
jgi:HPt (histidine-containing phosphotransfer) domain-containing protein